MTTYFQVVDGEYVEIEGEPTSAGYYYEVRYSSGAGDGYHYQVLHYSDGTVSQAVGYTENLVGTDGELYAYEPSRGRVGEYAVRSISEDQPVGNIADKEIVGFDQPMPPVHERAEDQLLPGEMLHPEGPDSGDNEETRSSITNNGYTLSLNENDELILTDADGNELWGYAGADAAELLSRGSTVKLTADGEIILLDADGNPVLDADGNEVVIREKGDDQHVELVLLYHPPSVSEPLRRAIDEARDALQLQVDCFGKGEAVLAEDVAEWLQNEGLVDSENTSALTLSYNESYLDYDTQVKNHFKDLDERIRTIAVNTNQVGLDAYTEIWDAIDTLDTHLRSIDAVEDVEVVSVGEQGSHTYRRILPDLEDELFGAIETTLSDVETIIADANQAMEDAEADTDEQSAEYQAGIDDGYAAGYEEGLAAAGGTDEDVYDFAADYDDLLGADLTGLADQEFGTSSLLDQSTSDVESGATASGGTESGAMWTGNNSSSDSSGNALSKMMEQLGMQQLISSLMNQDKSRGDESEDDPLCAEQSNISAAQSNTPDAVGDGTLPGAVTADLTTPPPVYPGNTMVDMKLPDGSTQKVPSVVAQAVNKELNNPNGSDARAAYEGTPGQASASNPWTAVNSANVRTGDVVQWVDRSGLVVVTDAGLQVIANGQLVALDPHIPPDSGHGGYGEFRGFFHPGGADLSGTTETLVSGTPSVPAPPAVPSTSPAAPTPSGDPK
ncbi:hypothetical protein OIE68_21035 [Nocardia vinacea]|uniref:hypothetical protein n=1 Tax=Nocardia vinacea TaxID=96468 RepID=UPI002E117EA8|nr:hypothetical protein OIE68_21035 [Nocardia vinacea]